MATDQFVVESDPVNPHVSQRRPSPASGGGRGRGMLLLILLLVAGVGTAGYFIATAKDRERPSAHEKGAHGEGADAASHLPRVEVVRPKRGGMECTTDSRGPSTPSITPNCSPRCPAM